MEPADPGSTRATSRAGPCRRTCAQPNGQRPFRPRTYALVAPAYRNLRRPRRVRPGQTSSDYPPLFPARRRDSRPRVGGPPLLSAGLSKPRGQALVRLRRVRDQALHEGPVVRLEEDAVAAPVLTCSIQDLRQFGVDSRVSLGSSGRPSPPGSRLRSGGGGRGESRARRRWCMSRAKVRSATRRRGTACFIQNCRALWARPPNAATRWPTVDGVEPAAAHPPSRGHLPRP